jgi:hypothetical protein
MTPIQHMIPQQIPYQRPIFSSNPLKMLINNDYSGTLHLSNLQQMNRLYEMMKEALLQESQTNINYTTSNFTERRIFMTVKGQKIFNIIKEGNTLNKRKSVKIIYNNDDEEYAYENYDEEDEKEEEYKQDYEEYEEYEEMEEEGKHGDDIFNAGHSTWDNYTAFK